MSPIYSYGIDHLIQQAQRADGQWFERHQDRTPYGYRWGAWRKCCGKNDRASLNSYAGKARLPKEAA